MRLSHRAYSNRINPNHNSRMDKRQMLVGVLILSATVNVMAQVRMAPFHISELSEPAAVSLGVRFSYLNILARMSERIDRYDVRGVSDVGEGYRIGLHSTIRKGRFHLQPELNYVKYSVNHSFLNTNPKDNANVPIYLSDWMVTGTVYFARKLETALIAGVHVLPWLRFQAGPVVSYKFDQANFNDIFKRRSDQYYNPNDELIYLLNESHRQWMLSGRYGVGVNLGRYITLDYAWEHSLTPTYRPFVFNGRQYEPKQTHQQRMLTAGLNVLPIPKRKR